MPKLLTTMIINVEAGSREDAMRELKAAADDIRATSAGGRELLSALREAVKAAVPASEIDETRQDDSTGYVVGDGHGYDPNTGITHGTWESR